MPLPATWSRGQRLWHWTLWGITALVLLFLVLPVLVIVPLSFSAGSFLTFPLPGLSLRWYEELLASATWRLAFRNSMVVAVATTVLATTLGTMAAMGLARARFGGRHALMTLLISPMVVPIVIVGVGVYFFFAPLGLTGSLLGLTLAHTVLAVPFVLITVGATLQGYDENLSRAAASLGAPPWTTFRRVVFPAIAPGVVSGAIFAFVIILRRAGDRTLPHRPRRAHSASTDVRRYPREHQPRHRRRRHLADPPLGGPHGHGGAAAPAWRAPARRWLRF